MFFVLLLSAFGVPSVNAERYAVLIGVNSYPYLPAKCQLKGPVNDVNCLKEVLVGRYGFAPGNVKTLLNDEATKGNILGALSRLEGSTKPGDFVFMYFSGHGTSTYDRNLGLKIGDETGAIIPCDFQYNKHDENAMFAKLIIGKRDLRPIFTELDKKRSILVVFDACFSGYSVRDAMSFGQPKEISLPFTNAELGFRGVRRTANSEPYPYQNIVYISASDETERAYDLTPAESRYDGKAHGALTDALLRGLAGLGDTNQDGLITYEELYQFVKRETQRKGQTPQLLFRNGIENAVFQKKSPTVHNNYQAPREPLRVKIEGDGVESIASTLKAAAGIRIADGDFDILLKRKGTGYVIYLSGGEKFCSAVDDREAATKVEAYAKAKGLIELRNPKQNFNVWMSPRSYEGKTVFFDGETLNFTLKSEADAELLLLDIDSGGNVCVLIPRSENAQVRISNGEKLDKEIGKVTPPFGVDFLKLFAFKTKVEGLKKFATGDGVLCVTGKSFDELMALIKRQSDWSETVQQIVTVQK